MGASLYRLFTPCVVDRPPTHFFVKKKFIPIGGAGSFERVLLRSDFLRGGGLVRRTESPSQGYRLSAASLPCPLVIRSEGTYGRGDRRCSEGAAVVEGVPHGQGTSELAHTDRKIDPSLRRNPDAAQEVCRTQGGAFFFTKKAYCVNQTACVAEGRKSLQTQPPLFRP